MRDFAKYILIIAVILCSACSKDEFNKTPDSVTFAARYTPFKTFDVSSVGTKAQPDPAQPTDLEKKIVSAYFLVFNGTEENAEIAECRTISYITENTIPTQTVYNVNGQDVDFTVCYLANVTEEFAKSIKKLGDIRTKQYSITYSNVAASNTWGIPTLDGEKCFPMFGMATYYRNTYDENQQTTVEVPFERLFAKVYVNISLSMDKGTWQNLTVPPYFRLDKYEIVNLPTKLVLAKSVESGNVIEGCQSAWYNDSKSFESYSSNLSESVNIFDTEASNLGDITGGLIGTQRVHEYEITLYVPEYALMPSVTSNTSELNKPNQIVSGTYPVHMKLNGVIHQPDLEDAEFNYTIYLGHNATNSFSFCRNTQYNNILTINDVNNAILGSDKRVEYKGRNLADINNTGTYNPANCYIISKPGRYIIPTFKGNTSEILKGKVDANSIVDINGSGNTVSNLKVATDANGKDCIVFDVNMSVSDNTVTTTSVSAGNKLITLKDNSGKIIWSWHLWFCVDATRPDNSEQLHPYVDSVSTSITHLMMNRPLGAIDYFELDYLNLGIPAWTDGLFYQWGRKDPFLLKTNSDNSQEVYNYQATGGTLPNSISYPSIFYGDWGGHDGWTGANNKKTYTDPCPPGYKVPNKTVWKKYSATDAEKTFAFIFPQYFPYDLQLTIDLKNNILYTSNGSVQANGKLTKTRNADFTYDSGSKEFLKGIKVLGKEIASEKYTNVVVEVKAIADYGSYWTNSDFMTLYEHLSADLSSVNWTDISSVEKVVRIVKYKMKKNNYKVSWSGITENWDKEWSDYKEGSTLDGIGKLAIYANLFTGTSILSDLALSKERENKSLGLQVRCVNE